MPQQVVIIGAVALGPKTACRFKRLEPDSKVIMLDRGSRISYGGCGIPYYVSGDVSDISGLQSTAFHMLAGPAGCGKSTLFRSIGGLWPYCQGTLTMPANERVLFLPQRPYLPIATLAAAVAYPDAPERYGDARITAVLTDCGLGDFASRLNEERHWSQELSAGEQQRLAFARALLLAPRWLFLDEASSALDEASEKTLYQLLTSRLPETAILSIAHRPALTAFHSRIVRFVPTGDTTTAAFRLAEMPSEAAPEASISA